MAKQTTLIPIRNGSWYYLPELCRSACRFRLEPGYPSIDLGFRISTSFLSQMTTNIDTFGINLVTIPAGTFQMGSPETEEDRYADESPAHEVNVAEFQFADTPTTQAQWRAVAALPQVDIPLNPDPSRFKGDDLPVDSVNWYEAKEFCARLSAATGLQVELPSEAKWEYACRAGTTTRYSFGDEITPEYANYADSNIGQTTPVKSYAPNDWGLYDMHGNVWEWTGDTWHDNYDGAPTDGSAWID